jgi:23S rRNA pseudouridine2605 synthase
LKVALERLQKVLAQAGLAARRKAEELIVAGRVRVDGVVVTQLGVKVDPRKQRIEVDGLQVRAEPVCYGVLHKPRGVVTSASDPEGRPTAQALLEDVGVRVVVVGRLDFNTSGVLLFTNDGDFAQTLSHARTSVPKVYAAMVQKYVTEEDLELFRSSIDIDGKKTRPAEVRILRREGDKTWLEITLREGKNRQVRRLGDHAGVQVVRLSRLSHAGIDAQGLRPGKWRFLTKTELTELKQQYGVPKKIYDSPPSAPRPQRPGAAAARGGGQRRAPHSRSADAPERGREARGPKRPSGSARSDARSGPTRSGAPRSSSRRGSR